MRFGNSKYSGAIFLIIIISLFLALELNQLQLPVLEGEEALEGQCALKVVDCLKTIWPHASLIKKIECPVMFFRYHSALQSYFLAPFLFFLGAGVFSLRIYEIFVGLLIVLAVYFVIKEFFDKKTASLAAILLTLNFVFLQHTRLGIIYGSIIQLIILLSLLFFLRWYRQGKYLYFYLGFFLLGVGLSVRIWFLWFILGLLVETVIFRKELKERFFRITILRRLFHFIIAAFSFGLGCFLLVYHNFTSNFSTVRYIFTHFSYPDGDGSSNLKYFQNLLIRAEQFILLLTGKLEFCFNTLQYNKNYFFLLLFGLALIWLIYAIVYSRFKKLPNPNSQKVIFFIILFSSVFLFSATTLSTFRLCHLMILYPLVQILIALAIVSFLYSIKHKFIRGVFVGICALAIISDVVLFFNISAYLQKMGGVGPNDDSIYCLADFLKSQNVSHVYASNEALPVSLVFLTGKDVVFRKIPNTIVEGELEKKFNYPELSANDFTNNALFVIDARKNSQFIKRFISLVKEKGNYVTKERQFYNRSGDPTYAVCSLGKYLDITDSKGTGRK